jgi:hypothetical protein
MRAIAPPQTTDAPPAWSARSHQPDQTQASPPLIPRDGEPGAAPGPARNGRRYRGQRGGGTRAADGVDTLAVCDISCLRGDCVQYERLTTSPESQFQGENSGIGNSWGMMSGRAEFRVREAFFWCIALK